MDPNTPLQPYTPPNDNGASVPPPLTPYAHNTPLAPLPGQTSSDSNAPFSSSPLLPAEPASPGSVPPAPLYQPPQMPGTPPAEGMGNPRDEVISRLQQANNVLVTVSNNPSVDQFAAAIGITLVLNKLDKHATLVFSGAIPNTIEFLQPEKTIEKNTDSLRDFIIALDKAKADKLRYKVEDKFVKIFITPYHTSLSDKDLEFSQGDFNVDVVLALGVHRREDLDQAITAHGRILHDATVVSVNNNQTADMGAINWYDATASSLSEMLVTLIEPLQGQKALLDSQIATAFLTGVVAETDRFSNNKTTPHTMSTSAILMKAGANQQLVATKLEEPKPIPQEAGFDGKKMDELAGAPVKAAQSKDGSLQIAHQAAAVSKLPSKSLAEIEAEVAADDAGDGEPKDDLDKIHIDEEGTLQRLAEVKEGESENKDQAPDSAQKAPDGSNEMILQPPSLGGPLTANTVPDTSVAPVNPLTPIPTNSQVPDFREVQHGKALQPLSASEKTGMFNTDPSQSLSDLEKSVDSPHADAARQAVADAMASQPAPLEPISALNAQPIDLGTQPPVMPTAAPVDNVIQPTANNVLDSAFPPQLVKPDTGLPPDPTAGSINPSAPPPVPPPLMPPPSV